MKFYPKSFKALEVAAAAIEKVPGIRSVDSLHDDESGEIWFELENQERYLLSLASDREMPPGLPQVPDEEEAEPLPPPSVQ